jgi:hypothetical protein
VSTTTKTFPVRFEQPVAGTHTNATARDVSLGGMFVATDSPPDEGTLLVIELDLEGIKVTVDARVLRREADGMAVAFIDLPDDVAATLSAAVTPASARTVLGIGSGNVKTTTPGVAVPPSEPRVPVSVPSINTTTPGIASPAAARDPEKAKPTPKPKPKPKSATKKEEPKEPEPEPDAPKRGSGGRWFFLVLLAGAGAAAYVYREPLRREIDSALGPAPTIAPTSSSLPESGAATPAPTIDAAIDATTAPVVAAADAALDASRDASADAARDASTAEAGAAKDAGVRDAGHRL